MSDVSVSIDKHVATVVFSRPPNNHVSVDLVHELANAFDALDENKNVRALVLASDGKNFCAGADLVGGTVVSGATASEAGGTNPLYTEATRLFAAKKPIVAAVQGAAVGAGLGLTLVADFRVASSDARLTANFTKLGFHPGFGMTHTLPRLVGKQNAALLFLTSRRLKAEEALVMGLVDQVVAFDDLRAAAQKLAGEIAENGPLAVQATRATLRGDLAAAVKAQTDKEWKEQSWLRQTKDFAEGVKSVNERRPGNFTGE